MRPRDPGRRWLVIIEALVDAVTMLVGWVSGLFPIVDISESFGSWQLVLTYAADLNYYLPISELFAVTLAVFYIFPVLMGVSIVVWLVALIRGGSSRG